MNVARARSSAGVAWLLTLCAGLAALAAPTRAAGQVAPDAHWKTISTTHFRITYEAGLDSLALHAAYRAELAYAWLAEGLTRPPGRVDIMLGDNADFSNGQSSPIPTSRVYIYVKPPIDDMELDYYRDWLGTVLAHELTHSFHLDRAGAVGRLLRDVFGRVPFGYPFFPALDNPGWVTEGIAVEFESRVTGEGRVLGSFHDMVLRTATLEHRFATIDRASNPNPLWPEGNHAYAYGSLFIDYLSHRFGPDAPREIVDHTAAAVIPPALDFNRVGSTALHESFTHLWRDWTDTLEQRYGRLADSLRTLGLTPMEQLTAAGRYAFYPRVSPDGRRLAYAAATGRSDPATWILDLDASRTGAPTAAQARPLARRNGGGYDLSPAAWLPDGSALVTAQLEFDGPYRIYDDLYEIGLDGHQRRLTRGQRLSQPDVSPDGRHVVAVRDGRGRNTLVMLDLRTSRWHDIAPPQPGVQWTAPRFSPDGRLIAVSRWSAGGYYDVVVVDTTGRLVLRVTRDRAVDHAPAWSPDGRWLLFSSDRSGIPDLYAARMPDSATASGDDALPELRRVTRVLTGAFEPDVSPDGRYIYFIGYHTDGYHVERMPFDTAGWQPPPPLAPRFTAPAPDDAVADSAARQDDRPSRPRGYSPFPSVLPHAWIPLVSDNSVTGTEVGFFTFGQDLVSRHVYSLDALYAPDTGRFEGALHYRYAGLGNPWLGLDYWRSWDVDGHARLPDSSIVAVLGRTDEVAVSATLLRQRWRSASALVLGAEHIGGHRIIDAPGFTLRPDVASIDRYGAFAVASLSTARAFNFSISPERGASLVLDVRRLWDQHRDAALAEDFTEVAGVGTAYHGFSMFGLHDHPAVAVRASGIIRTGDTAPTTSLGGAPGTQLGLLAPLGSIGVTQFLPVRGFPTDSRYGTRGWSASFEYRFPVGLVARGLQLWPAFLDELSGALFLDAGNAWCTPDQEAARGACNPPRPAGAAPLPPLVGAGAELALDVTTFFDTSFRLRAGVGIPVAGEPGATPRAYIALGPAF
jgi:Tol biopolymer transport system component